MGRGGGKKREPQRCILRLCESAPPPRQEQRSPPDGETSAASSSSVLWQRTAKLAIFDLELFSFSNFTHFLFVDVKTGQLDRLSPWCVQDFARGPLLLVHLTRWAWRGLSEPRCALLIFSFLSLSALPLRSVVSLLRLPRRWSRERCGLNDRLWCAEPSQSPHFWYVETLISFILQSPINGTSPSLGFR
jgi:hypothetical protein